MGCYYKTKCTQRIAVGSSLNHSPIPHCLWKKKPVFHETCPWCQRNWKRTTDLTSFPWLLSIWVLVMLQIRVLHLITLLFHALPTFLLECKLRWKQSVLFYHCVLPTPKNIAWNMINVQFEHIKYILI